jgi:hypothetical protein
LAGGGGPFNVFILVFVEGIVSGGGRTTALLFHFHFFFFKFVVVVAGRPTVAGHREGGPRQSPPLELTTEHNERYIYK